MTTFAELQVSLHNLGDARYRLELYYQNDPEDDDAPHHTIETVNLGDDFFAGLRARALDPDSAGKWLQQHVFTGKANHAFQNAFTQSQTSRRPLRVRLAISPELVELHQIPWETLIQPGLETPLATNEHILFSRYLYNTTTRRSILRSRGAISAIAVIASPSDLDSYSLEPINVAVELARVQAALKDIPIKNFSDIPGSTLDRLFSALHSMDHKQPPSDILYVLAHGIMEDNVPYLYLEDTDRLVTMTRADALVEIMAQLQNVPRLIVLASCESAGHQHANVLQALGPQLIAAGVPAVVAMQGQVTTETLEKFLPVLFRELCIDGRIDRAMAVARATIRHRPDWWMPVLFMRIPRGGIWKEEDRDVRQSLSNWLRRPPIRLHTQARDRLIDAILACPTAQDLHWADFDTIETLLDEICESEASSVQLQNLISVVEDIFPQPIPRKDVKQLNQFLRQVRLFEDDLHRLYYRNIPRGPDWKLPVIHDTRDALASIVTKMASIGINERTRQHPLINFIQDLLEEHGQDAARDVASALRKWLEDVSSDLGIPLPQPAPQSRSPHTMYLQVVVRPKQLSRPDCPLYYLTAWLTSDDNNVRSYNNDLPKDNLARSVEELPKVFQTLVRETVRLLPSEETTLIIEVFLPLELMLTDVDQWPISIGTRSTTKIGIVHSVVARSLERILPEWKDSFWQPWVRKWNRYQESAHTQALSKIFWIDGAESGQPEKLHGRLRPEDVVGVIQTWLPSDDTLNDEIVLNIADSILAAGIPIGVFIRSCRYNSIDTRRYFEQLLSRNVMCDLPAIVNEQRNEAAGNHEHYGCYLTVLWDDPKRLPPTIIYVNAE